MADPPRILVLFGGVALFGAERGNIEALVALKRQGAEVLFLLSDERWNTIIPLALEERGFAWRKVPYLCIGKGLTWYKLLWGNARRLVQANIAFLRAVRDFKPTHIHVNSQFFVANFLLGLTLLRRPLVFRAGDEPTTHNWFWRAAWRYVVHRTDRFVANSSFVAKSLAANGVPEHRIEVIYNKPPERMKMAKEDQTAWAPFAGRLIAYVGQIAEHKGPHLLIEAFKHVAGEFPDVRLALAGRISDWAGDAWARDLRSRTLADPPLANRVEFLGVIEDVPCFLAQSAFVVVPSLFADPSPNVIVEAKAAGRAVIGFPRGGIPELIQHGVDGLVCDSADAVALVRALRAYLTFPDQAMAAGEASRLSLAHLRVHEFAERWAHVYQVASEEYGMRRARAMPPKNRRPRGRSIFSDRGSTRSSK
ncbi:glycosyltransferase family 4 protein [Methylocystis sp. FS]|uniref:glycosyltransferase family 4 protein n=1 Tax=Methylocystis silviterrae TaxID=2743612 RepID=UPI0015823F7E|nr:glycosyltransferase family 4 protein [Methylocystis silviterrae]